MHALLHSAPLTLQQAPANPHLHWRLLDTPGQVRVSLLWGHCSFLLGPGAHKVLFVPCKSVSPVLCKFWWLYGGVNGALLQEGLCHTLVCCTQSPCPVAGHCQPTCPLENSVHSQASLAQFLVELLLLSPGSWCTQDFACALQESVSPVLWKFCNQIPLTFKVRLPENS